VRRKSELQPVSEIMEWLTGWILDRIADLVAWLVPGRFGKALGIFFAWVLFLLIIYLLNRETIDSFFG
jgi:hypothetical protein